MTTYRYDGTFAGFLCAVAVALEQEIAHPLFISDVSGAASGLFAGEELQVVTVREHAMTLRQRFVARVSREAFATLRFAFHSRQEDVESLLWCYVTCGLQVGKRLAGMLAEEPVYSVERLARRVSHEVHKFKGFARFQEVAAGFLYARIEPEGDVVELLAPHFVERVGDRPWMIHDVRRSTAVLYDLHSWQLIRGVELHAEPEFAEAEHEYAALWQRYFQRHAIAERHNPGLQQKHVPLRYRKYLTEFE